MTCLASSSNSPSVWCIDSESSSHMTGTGIHEHYTMLSQGSLDVDIELGDDTKVRVVGLGTVLF